MALHKKIASLAKKLFKSNENDVQQIYKAGFEGLEDRVMLSTNLGSATPGATLLDWSLEGVSDTFEYGLVSGAAGAGTLGDDIVLAGDFHNSQYDNAVVVRGVGGRPPVAG